MIEFLLANEEKLKAAPREEDDDDEFETTFTQKTMEGAVAGGLIKLLNLLKERGCCLSRIRKAKVRSRQRRKDILNR